MNQTLSKEPVMIKVSKKKPESISKGANPANQQDRVAEAAYYLAEKRGFEQGGELNDWFDAESTLNKTIDASLLSKIGR